MNKWAVVDKNQEVLNYGTYEECIDFLMKHGDHDKELHEAEQFANGWVEIGRNIREILRDFVHASH